MSNFSWKKVIQEEEESLPAETHGVVVDPRTGEIIEGEIAGGTLSPTPPRKLHEEMSE